MTQKSKKREKKIDKPLFFKHRPPKEWSQENFCLNVVLRKDGKTFDLRDKNTREFVYQNTNTRFYDFMQNLSYRFGNQKVEGIFNGLSWKHYFHPIKQIRFRLTGVWYL